MVHGPKCEDDLPSHFPNRSVADHRNASAFPKMPLFIIHLFPYLSKWYSYILSESSVGIIYPNRTLRYVISPLLYPSDSVRIQRTNTP